MLSNELAWLADVVPEQQHLMLCDAFKALEDTLGKTVYEIADQAHINLDLVESTTVIAGLRSDVLEMSFHAARQLGVFLTPDLEHGAQPVVTAILETLIQVEQWDDFFGLKAIVQEPANKESVFANLVEEITLVPADKVLPVIESVKDELITALDRLLDLKIQEFKLSQPGIPEWVARATLQIKRLADSYNTVFKVAPTGIFNYVQEGGELGKPLETYAEMFTPDFINNPAVNTHAFHWLAMHLASGLPKELYYDAMARQFDKYYQSISTTSTIVKTLKTLVV